MNYRLITHTDLDGVGCEILFKVIFGKDAHIDMANYDNVNEIVRDVLKDKDSKILITDLSVNKEVAKEIDNVNKVKDKIHLIDHHKTALWLNKYKWATVNDDYCGTYLLFDYLINLTDLDAYHSLCSTQKIRDYFEFVILVNDHDLWINKHPESMQLDRLYSLLGREAFVERMLNNYNVKFTDSEQTLLKVEDNRIKNYLKNKSDQVYLTKLYTNNCKDHTTVQIPGVIADQYISELGNYLLNGRDINEIGIINMSAMTVSLRSKSDYDCSKTAAMCGGGGHKNSAGFSISWVKFNKVNGLIEIQPKTIK